MNRGYTAFLAMCVAENMEIGHLKEVGTTQANVEINESQFFRDTGDQFNLTFPVYYAAKSSIDELEQKMLQDVKDLCQVLRDNSNTHE